MEKRRTRRAGQNQTRETVKDLLESYQKRKSLPEERVVVEQNFHSIRDVKSADDVIMNASTMLKSLSRRGQRTKEDIKPLHLQNLIKRGKNDELYELLAANQLTHEIDLNTVDSAGDSFLHIAAKSGNADATKLLLAHDVKVNLKDGHGFSSLHYAVQNGSFECASLLVENGASVDSEVEHGMIAPVQSQKRL